MIFTCYGVELAVCWSLGRGLCPIHKGRHLPSKEKQRGVRRPRFQSDHDLVKVTVPRSQFPLLEYEGVETDDLQSPSLF